MELSGGFQDECGVFGVCDSQDAANIAYLGLYALQHRGQESAGIATLENDHIYIEREMGYVADVFDEARLSRLPGRTAIGHVRYSTAGASLLANAQPIAFATGRGPLALAHNGNLVNAREIRRRLESSGALFTTTSDTEVILHLVARSKAPDVGSALAEALLDVQGAYSILVLSREGIFAARVRELDSVYLRARLFRSSRFQGLRQERRRFPRGVRGAPCAGASGGGGPRRSGARLRHVCRPGLRARVGDPVRSRARPKPLRRPDLHRAETIHPPLRRQGEAESGPRGGRGQADRPRGRLDRARDDVEKDRADATRRRSPRDPRPGVLAADDGLLPLRHRHADASGADRFEQFGRGDPEFHRGRHARLPLVGRDARGLRAAAPGHLRGLLHGRLSGRDPGRGARKRGSDRPLRRSCSRHSFSVARRSSTARARRPSKTRSSSSPTEGSSPWVLPRRRP